MCLSATVTEKVCDDIKDILHIPDPQIVALLPDRPNIFFEVRPRSKYDVLEEFQWVIDGLRSEKDMFPKTLIFAPTISVVFEIFSIIKKQLGASAYTEEGHRLIDFYHGQLDEEKSKIIPEQFKSLESSLRVLPTTKAFGMGIEAKGVVNVVHWGKPDSMLSYLQEAGRAGRDGSASRAIYYPKGTPGVLQGEDKDLFLKIKRDRDICIREVILSHFKLPQMPDNCLEYLTNRVACKDQCTNCTCAHCLCCSNCKQNCPCV